MVKHKPVQQWKFYKIESGKAVAQKKNCPRCGAGTFLAEHKSKDAYRVHCGKCGYSEIKK